MFKIVSWFVVLSEIEIDPCSSNPCLNEGDCDLHIKTGYRCFCPLGYGGLHCEQGKKQLFRVMCRYDIPRFCSKRFRIVKMSNQ